MWIKKQHNFFKNKLFSSSQYFVCLLAQINAQKMFFVADLFSKREHYRIKLLIYSYLISKFLTENFVFCVVKIIGFIIQPWKFFFKSNYQSLAYFTSINTWHRLVSTLLFRNQFLACSKGLELSAQELLHDNQYTFRTQNILQTFIVWRRP